MHDTSFDRVADILAQTEETFAGIVERADKYERATVEGARRVEEWARTIIEQDNQYASLFVTTADEINENCAREQELEKIALQTIEENQREEEMHTQEATELEGVVQELDSQKSRMPEDHQRLRESLREKRDVVEDREHQVEGAKRRLDGKISGLQDVLNKFQDALGLKLEVIDDSLVRYIFVCIDPSAHDRTFSVATKFTEGEGLIGTKCVPMVQKFGDLNEQLRKTGELVPFLRDMRKEFQRLAMS